MISINVQFLLVIQKWDANCLIIWSWNKTHDNFEKCKIWWREKGKHKHEKICIESPELCEYEINLDKAQENVSEESDDNDQKVDKIRKLEGLRKQLIQYPGSEIFEALFCLQETLTFDNFKCLAINDQHLRKNAMDEEIDNMKINNVWDLEELIPDLWAISCKWVFRKKRNEFYKACHVAHSFMQKKKTRIQQNFFTCDKYASFTSSSYNNFEGKFMCICIGCKDSFPVW